MLQSRHRHYNIPRRMWHDIHYTKRNKIRPTIQFHKRTNTSNITISTTTSRTIRRPSTSTIIKTTISRTTNNKRQQTSYTIIQHSIRITSSNRRNDTTQPTIHKLHQRRRNVQPTIQHINTTIKYTRLTTTTIRHTRKPKLIRLQTTKTIQNNRRRITRRPLQQPTKHTTTKQLHQRQTFRKLLRNNTLRNILKITNHTNTTKQQTTIKMIPNKQNTINNKTKSNKQNNTK